MPIETIIQTTHPLHKNPPEAVLELALLHAENHQINAYVTQSLLIKFGLNKHRMLRWHFDYFFWNFLIELHFSDKDMLTLWCHLASYEKGNGLNDSANYYYGCNLNQLNDEEIATVIVMTEAPLYYKAHPEKLKEDVWALLKMK